MALESIITTYGYPALFAGVFLEGETVLILAGYLAHQGYMTLPWVVAVSFMGALLYTQLFFLIGHHGGRSFIDRKPQRQLKAQQIRSLLDRHETSLLIGFRFLYGFRTLTPFVIGLSGFNPQRFITMNLFGTIAWTVVYAVIGYLFGHVLELFLDDIKRHETTIVLTLMVTGTVVWLVYNIFSRYRTKKTPLPVK